MMSNRQQMGRPQPDTAQRLLLLAAATIVAAWFALPALQMAYTEGFQAQMALNARALAGGDAALGDPVYPFNGRFFLLTRLGNVLALAGLQHVGAADALAAFRGIGIASMIVLVAALLALLWRAYRVGPALGLVCCILFPTVFESAYLPNDDMPSAVLVCLAVLVFWTRPTLARTALTGVLLGFAVLLRLDAALTAPAFAILLFTEIPGPGARAFSAQAWGARAIRAVIAGVPVVGIPIVAYHLAGLSFFDTFAAINHATALWDRPSQPLRIDIKTALLSVPAAGGLAWVLGVAWFAQARRWRDLALATVVPALYVAAYRNQLVEGRYLLPLAPFVLPAIAMGLRFAVTAGAPWRPWFRAALAITALVWIIPMPALGHLLGDADGPRFVVGRAWNPLAALWWERRLNADKATLAANLEHLAASPDPVVVTNGWTADRLTTLTLVEHGFTIQPGKTPTACQGIAETLVRGPTVLLHIRTHIPYVLHKNERVIWEEAGLPCLKAARPDVPNVVLAASGPLDSPALDAPAPPIVPRLGAILTGLSVSTLPVAQVTAALPGPENAEDRSEAENSLRSRAALLQ